MAVFWMIDSALTGSIANAKPIPGALQKDARNPLFLEGLHSQPVLPWEALIANGYPNVFFDQLIGKYRCYYTAYLSPDASAWQQYKSGDGKLTAILYAESSDGIRWEKPPLGVITHNGSSANNIIARSTHGASVLLDESDPDPNRRYKLISRDDRGPLNIHAAFSADGIHFDGWTAVIDDPRLPGDTHNFALRDPHSGQYLLYTRTHVREMRVEARLISDDFLHWREAAPVLSGADADDQIYGMPVFVQDGLYWGLAEIFYVGDSSLPHFDHVEVELCYSGDGLHWQRVCPGTPFLPNGAADSCDFGCCYTAAPVACGDTLRFYYMGGSGTHYHLKQSGLCLATVQKNRLAGVTARQGNQFQYQTRKLLASGDEITLCADVAAGGCIRYALLDEHGAELPGYSLTDCQPITASVDQATLRWQGKKAPARRCMLRFDCQSATLYSLTGDMELIPKRPL